MKVCHVTANFPPEANGGTEQVVAALIARLQPHGVQAMVLAGSEAPGPDALDRVDGVEVHRLRRRADEHDRHGFVRPRLLALLRDRLRHGRPDVVHIHSSAVFGAGVAALAHELGMPVVMTFHDLYVTCARFFRLPYGGVRCPVGADRTPCVTCVNDALQVAAATVAAALAERDRLLRAEVALVDACTAPSATAAAFVRDGLPFTGAIEVIPHGLLRPVASAERAAPPGPGEPLRIGTFGGLVAEKGVFELIDAVAGLPCELQLSGRLYDEAIRTRLLQRQEQGLRWHLRGTYTVGDRHPARDLHLAVFPSRCQETYGLVVDEALAHGVPVVCSDAGALRERAATGGVMVTPIAQLADVLRTLVTSPDRLAALRAAIPAELPTIESSAQRHLELYRRLR